MPTFDNGTLPWETNNVEDIYIHRNSDRSMNIRVVERTRLGTIETRYKNVTAIDWFLEGDTLTIRSLETVDPV